MFNQTIDNKTTIVDPNGNEIVDLAKSIFSRSAGAISGYRTVKMTSVYNMRPDKASFDVYGNENYAEMILKYSGISNPFSMGEDDVLMIPELNTIYNQIATDEEVTDDTASKEEQIRNYYKFTSKYKADKTSYDELENLKIGSGVAQQTDGDYLVPYISADGQTAVTIRNGRMYFGEDAGNVANVVQSGEASGVTPVKTGTAIDDTLGDIYSNADIAPQTAGEYAMPSISGSSTDNFALKMQAIIDGTATAMADQCAMNGMSMVDFTRASTRNGK